MIVSVAQAEMFFLALSRILAIIIHVPVLAGPLIPNQIKIGLGFVLTMILIAWQPISPETPSMAAVPFGLAIGKEILIGTLVGFAAELAIGAIRIAGEIIGIGSGFSAGKVLNPALESSGSAIDQFFLMMAMLIFLVINGHHLFLLSVQQSFIVLPLGSELPALTYETLIRMTSQFVVIGVQLAMPVMGALLLADLTLGLLARVAPQVQVFFLGIPLKVGIGLLVLGLTMGVLLPSLREVFNAMGPNGLKLLGG